MCVGIAIVGIVPESGPIQFFGKEGNSSHDTLLSECVPVELHNRSFKLEYIFPNTIRLDAPDAESRKQAVEFGIADIQYGIAILRPETALAVALWLKEHPLHHGRSTMQQAYLSRANLSRANLSRANLSGADLSEADLSEANLSRANLSGADLSVADLSGADLSRANLSGADLFGADLSGANLFGADLSGADLSRANLSGADLFGADLFGADLSGADLFGAILSDEQKEIAKKKGAGGVV
jgi:hypothetical protein